MIDFNKYEEDASRTFLSPKTPVTPEQIDQLHCVIGIETEAGELLDAYKKHIFYGKPLDTVNVAEEIGDLMWYIANLCQLTGLNMQTILANNISKLKNRFPEKFSHEDAINRDVITERQILEGNGIKPENDTSGKLPS